MKTTFLLLLAFTLTGTALRAQPTIPIKKVMELKMPKTAEDDMPGTRGASVIWHPVLKKYYASFAGNVGYPMAVFDATGKRLSDDELTTMMDTRGLWYNAATKKLYGNGYGDFGWFTYTLDSKGIPTDIDVIKEGTHQPDGQSVGTYNALTKQILFLNASQVYMYNNDAELKDSVTIHWGRKKTQGADEDEDIYSINEDYNSSSLIYTGVKGQELGFLNITDQKIELYDSKTGFLSKVLKLPETATTEATFNFAFANGTYWLFDMELRKWVGYK
ncbi:MAG: hypothetical protein WDN26_19350 [Chitinophagaceae bacterium]